MLTPTSLPTLSADGEPVDRHGVALGTLVVRAEDHDPQGVHLVAELRHRPADLVDVARGEVVDRSLADAVDVDGDLALAAVAHRGPGDRPAAEGQADRLTLQVGRHRVPGVVAAPGDSAPRGGQLRCRRPHLADGEGVDGDERCGRAPGTLDAQHPNGDDVPTRTQALEGASDAVVSCLRVVADRRLALTVDEHPRLALCRAGDGPPGEGAAPEGPLRLRAGLVLADEAAAEGRAV